MDQEFNPKEIRLILGIGNPGESYTRTYHNIGILFVSSLSEALCPETKFKDHASGLFEYKRCLGALLARSLVFMNQSGKSASRAQKLAGGESDSMLIVHDDSDLAIGSYKLSFDRGSAGHHGIDSVVAALGTSEFWRLRIGIREPENSSSAGDFVLQKIAPDHEERFEKLFQELVGVVTSEKNS